MRWIQNTAIFGLLGGSVIMLFGMGQGNAALTVVGAAFGLLVGLPAAYIHFFTVDGLSWQTLKTKFVPRVLPQIKLPNFPKPESKATPTPPAPKSAAPIVEDDELPIPIPVRVERPMAPMTPPAPDAPLQPSLSPEERQVIVDDIKTMIESNELAEYLQHSDALVRLYAVQRLGEMADEGVEARLRLALNDGQMVVQRAARLALERLGYDDTAPQSAHANN